MGRDDTMTNLSKEVERVVIEAMVRFEGFSIQEAKLTYKARQDLPATAFCGPDRTYPAHDAKHVRNAFARLSQFGHRLSKAVRGQIVRCLTRRAKRYGVEHDSKSYKWKTDGSANVKIQETAPSKVSWYLKELGIEG